MKIITFTICFALMLTSLSFSAQIDEGPGISQDFPSVKDGLFKLENIAADERIEDAACSAGPGKNTSEGTEECKTSVIEQGCGTNAGKDSECSKPDSK